VDHGRGLVARSNCRVGRRTADGAQLAPAPTPTRTRTTRTDFTLVAPPARTMASSMSAASYRSTLVRSANEAAAAERLQKSTAAMRVTAPLGGSVWCSRVRNVHRQGGLALLTSSGSVPT
jgi:hypothetical protein